MLHALECGMFGARCKVARAAALIGRFLWPMFALLTGAQLAPAQGARHLSRYSFFVCRL